MKIPCVRNSTVYHGEKHVRGLIFVRAVIFLPRVSRIEGLVSLNGLV